ncbi:5-(carboxyamino)imidazole ribonucleotide synthase [uncultured Maricaulis sp.]|uniref:5-(carboxyamino)imidazole ribonucleotide synthase n=1 Tax=uncultured Maricaulis sp. TaxID=174710 RepID=UPI0030DB8C84|tara:strand:+ start:14065 stop:15150 length:1086 start_codon:yes stop_codon:yes gene_type:complete
MSKRPLAPGSVIGILGGGQLGRMLAIAGARLGFDMHIFDPEPDCPAARVAARSWAAPWSDAGAVEAFADRCDAMTYEFENIPVEAVTVAAATSRLQPGALSLELTQDRITEKRFINDAGVATVPFAPVGSASDLPAAIAVTGLPAVLKTRRFGYDGKGQAWIRTPEDAAAAWEAIGEQPAILEGAADFVRELSVVAARSVDGVVKAWPLSENVHGDGILKQSTAPAPGVDAALQARALEIATALGDGMAHVGVFAVELFDLGGGTLLVNEIAPRVHNTGHWTMDACGCDQFEQHIRAVAGWPLGDPAPHSSAVMTNLIGHDVDDWQALVSDPHVRLHLYGKRKARKGRKMGHVNRLGPLNG